MVGVASWEGFKESTASLKVASHPVADKRDSEMETQKEKVQGTVK